MDIQEKAVPGKGKAWHVQRIAKSVARVSEREKVGSTKGGDRPGPRGPGRSFEGLWLLL